jgi:hypothetical protein
MLVGKWKKMSSGCVGGRGMVGLRKEIVTLADHFMENNIGFI